MGLLKTLIKLLLWLAGLGVVALAALVILVAKIDPNEHKDWLEARFHKQTGREISLDGPIAFTFYPWLGVEAADVSIADTEEFEAEPFVYLDYLKLRTLPLSNPCPCYGRNTKWIRLPSGVRSSTWSAMSRVLPTGMRSTGRPGRETGQCCPWLLLPWVA